MRLKHPAAFLRRLPFRTRLAASFTGLFLLAGLLLLAFVVVLAGYGTAQQVQGVEVGSSAALDTDDSSYRPTDPAGPGRPRSSPASGHDNSITVRLVDQTVSAVQEAALHQMLLWSGIGLVLIALIAGVMGWWFAGQALRPIAAVTDAARRISEQNLHERLTLAGPDDELYKLADTFDGMLDRLEKSFESQRRFVANASHELRTPLAVQRASLEIGLADPLPRQLADVREDLLAANRDAEKLIASLLLLARSDRGLEEAEEIDLANEARQTVGELQPLADEKHVALILTADIPLPVTGDRVLLRHLVTNLVQNAIQYNRPGGNVAVRLTGRTLTVTNTGPPVAPDQVDGLFEPFRRLGHDRIGTTGHGLGLSIVKSIADAHSGTIIASPVANGGLTVTVSFSL